MEKKPPYGRKVKDLTRIPKAPPTVEEPLRGIQSGKVVCSVCGKAFVTKNLLDKHMLAEHKLLDSR